MNDTSPRDPLEGLSDFQRDTAVHAFRRLYVDADSTKRFLVADETGLGKTHVARGVIGLALDHLQRSESVKRIDIVYVCSNLDIAAQNITKLNVTGSSTGALASRLGLLVTRPEMLRPTRVAGRKPTTFVAFTPSTSLQLRGQMGQAPERAVLYVLLRDHLNLRGARATAAQRVFQGAVRERRTFVDWYVPGAEHLQPFEPGIQRAFLRAFDRSEQRSQFDRLLDEVTGRPSLSPGQRDASRALVGALRQMLALAAVQALEPDLVILDEFQRFRDLLATDTDDPAAELAHYFFNQPNARVLLLSATPYKAFTYAEEADGGDDHYGDFIKTLGFLAGSEANLGLVREDLDALRRAALADAPVTEIRDRLQSRLGKLMARTERPSAAARVTGDASMDATLEVRADEFTDYVALKRVADTVDAPLTVEYWKSAPYFFNFLDGYRIGERLREEMKQPSRREELAPAFHGAQRITRGDVERFAPIDWGNARLRALADDTIDRGWWRLLWVPPSLPYHRLGGPFAEAGSAMTKRLIFSSWVAAPSAIASLLSYEVERRIATEVGGHENTPEARAAISSRLDYRMTAGRPGAMSTLALFWPHPALARATDPLEAARSTDQAMSVEDLHAWGASRARDVVGDPGTSRAPGAAAWHWMAPVLAERGSGLGAALLTAAPPTLVEAMQGGGLLDDEPLDASIALTAHVATLIETLGGAVPSVDRPADLLEASALIGLGGPGNIAWRAIGRLRRAGDAVTELGQWRAAAILSAGLRSLFSRPDAMLLLDGLYTSGGSTGSDEVYWRAVARYCIDGGLQAVLDEYLHHLAGETGSHPATDDDLVKLATTARRAIALRESGYQAADIDDFGNPIRFPSRFALRFGNTRQAQDDARLPEVRAAFNSPFWPFVLATTSVGQEGVDFHWWCHSIVHWNLPANPVDFEQREGRVNRYKGHAIRKNVAAAHRAAAFATGVSDPWAAAFEAASAEPDDELGDLSPEWVYPGDASIQRRILAFPLSRDVERWRRLSESLALYRLAFGQPRQEDMIAALERRGVTQSAARLAELRIDLRPPSALV